jgi:hypothetical protein
MELRFVRYLFYKIVSNYSEAMLVKGTLRTAVYQLCDAYVSVRYNYAPFFNKRSYGVRSDFALRIQTHPLP